MNCESTTVLCSILRIYSFPFICVKVFITLLQKSTGNRNYGRFQLMQMKSMGNDNGKKENSNLKDRVKQELY